MISTQLTRLEAVQEGFEDRNASGENAQALHDLDENGCLPHVECWVAGVEGEI